MPKTKQQEAQEKRLQANIQQARKNRSAVKKAVKNLGLMQSRLARAAFSVE